MEYNWFTIIVITITVIVFVIVLSFIYSKTEQRGGEYVYYYMLGPENSQRKTPLGYLTETKNYVAPSSQIPLTRHATSSRNHSHNKVHSNGVDERHPMDEYVYRDTFDWKPYDWRPFEWKPYWERQELLCTKGDCGNFATDQCIGTGASDFQSCYDYEKQKCQSKSK